MVRVWSLVGELKSHVLRDVAKRIKKKERNFLLYLLPIKKIFPTLFTLRVIVLFKWHKHALLYFPSKCSLPYITLPGLLTEWDKRNKCSCMMREDRNDAGRLWWVVGARGLCRVRGGEGLFPWPPLPRMASPFFACLSILQPCCFPDFISKTCSLRNKAKPCYFQVRKVVRLWPYSHLGGCPRR